MSPQWACGPYDDENGRFGGAAGRGDAGGPLLTAHRLSASQSSTSGGDGNELLWRGFPVVDNTLRRMMVILLALTVSTVLFAAPAPPSVNLLANPSFEQPQGDVAELAAGWAPYQCGYTRTRERSYAPEIDGPWSCRISGAGGADERGLGGTNTGVRDGLPEHGTFAATNSIDRRRTGTSENQRPRSRRRTLPL